MTSEEIWKAVVESNRAWLEGRPADLRAFFHEDAVAVFPAAGRRVEGRDAIVESYVEYCEHVKTHAFEELQHSVDVFGDTAIVQYRFSVRYEHQGEIHEEQGQEMLVFVRRERWCVIWRTQVPLAG
jgi:ketosteroid isomerase-like protein